ncbi:MAG: LysR family transcriptional regulator [Rhodospirillales bacterium]|nr:LysR family transcriptional regulator [Rhodospirillales bacterium]
MDWDKLRVFHAVAEAGSFTHAGETLNLSQSAVSRQISNLEESLHVPLFHRHARGLMLTEQGDLLHRTARDMAARLSMTTARIRESRDRPQGRLLVTATVGFGSVWLTPRLNDFLKRYPEIDISLVLADTELDLSMREADVAIRMAPPRQPDLVKLHLMKMRYRVVASPSYLNEHPAPKTPEELDDHKIVIFGEDASPPVSGLDWLLEVGAKPGKKRRPALRVNSSYGIFRAVQSGLGIAAVPDYLAREGRGLVRVLPNLEAPTQDAYFVYPEELRNSMRIQVFRDFLVNRINAEGIKEPI